MTKKVNFKNQALKINVKEMIDKSKKEGLIKTHTEAFKINPVNKEKHKGKMLYIIMFL